MVDTLVSRVLMRDTRFTCIMRAIVTTPHGDREELERKIYALIRMIGADMAALRSAFLSEAARKQLLLIVDKRRVRLALLQEQRAALPD
jgi:hypothetical protein